MYFYYMIAAMGPKYQKFIWWKKYLTSFQMVQFVAIFIHQFQLLFRECNYPKGFMIWIGLHGAMFLFLFSDFYKTKYTPKPGKMTSIKNGTSNGSSNGVSKNSHFFLLWWFAIFLFAFACSAYLIRFVQKSYRATLKSVHVTHQV